MKQSFFLQNKKIIVAIASVLFVVSTLAFDSDETNEKTVSSKVSPQKPASVEPALKLEPYNGGFFTVEKPAGWQIMTAGQGTTLGVVMRDPQEPARQAFFFGAVGPIYLSQEQKAIDQQYVASGGYPVPWLDMPVVSPPTVSNFLSKWNAIANTNAAKSYMADVPLFNNLTIISTQPIPSQCGGGTSELVRALYTLNGKVVEGIFTATVLEAAPFANGPGGHHAYAFMFMGVTAPQKEFIQNQPYLVRSLSSFNLSEQYVKQYMASSKQAFASVMRAGQTLRETSDMIFDRWNARQKSYDVMAAKRSDAILSKERFRDSQTGEVYEFDNGWYDKYNIHRENYNKQNLQPIADNDYDGWTAPTLNGPNHVYVK